MYYRKQAKRNSAYELSCVYAKVNPGISTDLHVRCIKVTPAYKRKTTGFLGAAGPKKTLVFYLAYMYYNMTPGSFLQKLNRHRHLVTCGGAVLPPPF